MPTAFSGVHVRAGFHLESLDESRIRMLLDAPDLAFDALHTVALGELAEEFCVDRCVEVIRVIDIRLRAGREFLGLGRLVLEAEFTELGLDALRQPMQPEVMECAGPGGLAIHAEGVDVTVARYAPVLEQDAELEGRCRRSHELLLVDAQQFVKRADRRDRRLTHADGADLLRLHERDVEDAVELMGQSSRGHPAGRTASGNDDAAAVTAGGDDEAPDAGALRRRYIEELRYQRPRLTSLRRRARQGTLTLVYAAQDAEHNDAVVLAELAAAAAPAAGRAGRRPGLEGA